MKALVVTDLNKYGIESVNLDPPKAGEIMIKMAATGVCHSDLSVINGTIPVPMQVVIGHEGAGIVEQVGESVTEFEVGDHVVLSFVPVCGKCHSCLNHRPYFCTADKNTGKLLDGTSRVHRPNGEDLNVMTCLGLMAEYAVVPAISAVKIDKEIPLDKAALVGCAVMTGVGAVTKTAKIPAGSSVVVFGCGGVGLSVIQGAKLAGAAKIIGVDLADNKLEFAKKFGASHVINSGDDNAIKQIKALTGGGADFAFEAVGLPALMEAAYATVRRGGTAVIVGVGKLTDSFSVNAFVASMSGKTIKGSYYGETNPKVDFPKMLELYQLGRLNLDDMVTKTYTIDDSPQAFIDMENNVNARGVILFD